MKQIDKNILEKYLKNTASTDEQARIEKMFASKGDVRSINDYIKKDWNEYFNSDETIDKDMSSILNKIHHTIHLNENKLNNTIVKKLNNWFYKIAAILVIPLMITAIVMFFKLEKANNILAESPSMVSINSPRGSKLAFHLPDGSKGTLNSGSSLEYAIPFTNNRNIKLTGEAYFNVTQNKEHPFTVSTKSLNIRALGTRFNVYAYAETNRTEVILEEGKVECSFGSKHNKIYLKPNERIVLSDGKITKSEVNALKFIAWKDGKLIFRGDLMPEVAHRLERWFNIEIEIADKELLTYSFRGTFENDSLEEILKLLKKTSPIDCKIIKRKELQDGSFTKKKVIFHKKK